MKKTIKWILVILVILVSISVIFLYKNLHSRHPGYSVNLNIHENHQGILKTGFAALTITPEIPDRWNDNNHDGQYNPKDGDTYEDLNHNGKFDAIWMAGFRNRRPANGIHDNLWARTMIIDDGKSRIAIIAIDAIGIMHDDIVEVRNKIPESDHITYSIISSTHTHEGPDLLGLWGKTYFSSGVNRDYIDYVKSRIVESVETAVQTMAPTKLVFSQVLRGMDSLVVDSRKPVVKDPGIRIIQAISTEDNHVIGELVTWACHPEILWDKNLLITSDFINYVREGIEKGVYAGDSLVEPGQGGVTVYINGCIGGLMTLDPETAVYDPWLKKDFKTPDYEKARSLGYQVASKALQSPRVSSDTLTEGSIDLVAKSIYLPLNNKLFRLAESLGVIDRGLNGWWKIQTEIAAVNLGPATLLTLPGEMYPEIVNGGVESPPGADYKIPPMEIPPLRQLFHNKYRFVLGLANDEIGYIIPQSEWDVDPPYLYNEKESPYGEINSLGPETAPLLYLAMQDLLKQLQQ